MAIDYVYSEWRAKPVGRLLRRYGRRPPGRGAVAPGLRRDARRHPARHGQLPHGLGEVRRRRAPARRGRHHQGRRRPAGPARLVGA
ncbi:hypothetical protein LV779_18170 [Streptomyces thinghirensis]|nr:hypothetical protein [Streptomyces thinghirensis]